MRVVGVLDRTRGVGERSCADIWEKGIQAERTVCAKALSQGGAGMLEEEQMSEGEREGEGLVRWVHSRCFSSSACYYY